MSNAQIWMRLLAPLTVALAGGCAPAYHSNSDCRVSCKYCPPPPLPYARYDECVCHSSAASRYLSMQPPDLQDEHDVAPANDVPLNGM